MNKSLRRALWAGAIVAVTAAAVPMVQASAAVACAPAWSASAVYVKDHSVSYQSKNYTAKWWTTNEVPTASGEWALGEERYSALLREKAPDLPFLDDLDGVSSEMRSIAASRSSSVCALRERST